tara:strand:+ start:167 stop:1096 length:930 start_codon:yes stop_codon:yes gene_type:complete
MAFKMKGSPAKMGTIKGTTAHRSALRQIEEEKNLFEKHEEWKRKRAEKRKAKIESGEIMGIKEKMDRKHGTGEYARSGKKAHLAMKPGESKFQYDVRMRKEARKAAKTESEDKKSTSTYQAPDPSAEISTGGPSYDYQMQERNPGDLITQDRSSVSRLPSAPGDQFEYWFHETGNIGYRDTSKGEDAEYEFPKRGSKEDKAIRKRYTGSETGDLSNWYGHDAGAWANTFDEDDLIIEGPTTRRKSYLPYDLAQKHYNPKGSPAKKHQQLENEKNKIASKKGTENYEYSKAAEAVNIANASKTKPWGIKK